MRDRIGTTLPGSSTLFRAALVLLLLTGTAVTAAGQASSIHLVIKDRAELPRLTRMLSIDDVRGLEVWATATPRELQALAGAGYEWTTMAKAAVTATMCPAGWATDPNRSWTCYPSWAQYVQLLSGWETAYPSICTLVTIGQTTNQSRPHQLLALKISDNPGVEEDEPEVLYTSTMHGDETTGFMLMLRLIDELLQGYGSNAELTSLVDNLEIWINPLANPDGTYYSSDTDLSGATRYYTTSTGGWTGVDPNRNFPDPDEGPHPDGNPWWAETEAMIALAEGQSFVISANFHGGIEVVNYPWDTWARRHPEDAWLIDISRAYADAAQANSPAGYMTALDNGITNGWDWYPVAGGRQDFMTHGHGCRETTIELSDTKLLNASLIPAHWSYNRESLLTYMAQSLKGIRGLVLNSAGQPLPATVEVVGLDTVADGSAGSTDSDIGDYHRMLLPGTYQLRFSAIGYQTLDVSGVVVTDGDATRLDVVLLQPGEAFDLGDLPAPYATTMNLNGARHVIDGLSFGSCVDGESDGLPASDGLGDDLSNTGCADDEGVLVASGSWNDGTGHLEISGGFSGDGCLNVWLDFTDGATGGADGDLGDQLAGIPERVVENLPVTAATTSVTFDLPPGIIDTGASYPMRSRLTPRDMDNGCAGEEAYLVPAVASPGGAAAGGMVIDTIVDGAAVPVELTHFTIE